MRIPASMLYLCPTARKSERETERNEKKRRTEEKRRKVYFSSPASSFSTLLGGSARSSFDSQTQVYQFTYAVPRSINEEDEHEEEQQREGKNSKEGSYGLGYP